jgi:hypothetical protein
MPETVEPIEFLLELPIDLRRRAELYMLKHGVDFDTLLERALTEFLDFHDDKTP